MNFQLWLIIFLLLLGLTAAAVYVGVVLYHLFKPVQKKKKKSGTYSIKQLKDVGEKL